MKIKTIWAPFDKSREFDAAVNEAVSEGWILTKRDVLPGQQYNDNNWARRILYAELALPDPPVETPEPEAPDLLTCMAAIRAECYRHVICDECPLHGYCDFDAPPNWTLPEVKG